MEYVCSSNTFVRVLLITTLMQAADQNVLNVAQGKIRSIDREGYVSYVGIPYASVVGGVGRFKQAGIAPVWDGVRESREPHCSLTSAVEDCLQLDVHVPIHGTEMSTFVWVQGGSGRYHPGKLVSRGITVVVVRHRMGPIGFLRSKEDKIAGNVGLKDVLLALRWIRDNIIAFNGNPHRVVVGGQGFGAAMVEALMLAPSSIGLYHGVILQSGSILCPWAFNFDAEERAAALRNMLYNNSEDTVSSIMKADTVTLAMNAEKIYFPYIPFGICAEIPSKYEEAIVLESPFNLMLKGGTTAIPVLMGYNTNEAYIFASKLNEAKVTLKMNRDMTFLIPEELQNLSKGELTQITERLNDTYFGERRDLAAVLSYHRDAYFLSHIHRSVRFHATTHQPVYYYQLSYSGDIGVISQPGLKKNGSGHSDELGFLFPPDGSDLRGDDGVVQQHLIRLWSNFIKRLNPTPEVSDPVKWQPTSAQRPRVLDINTELEMREFPHSQAVSVWENIYEKYYYSRHDI